MSATTFTDITPERVTEALKSAGHLQRGSVTRVVSQPLSDVPFGAPKLRKLEITYSADAACQVPEHLILKIAKKEKEYFFYTQIAKWMENPPIPECYFATQNADKSQATFLLEDLSATHFQTEWPLPPIQTLCEAAIDCLAAIHAFWWNDPRLETELCPKVTQGNFWTGRLIEAIRELPAFLDFIGDRLSGQRKQVYEKVLASSNQFWRPDTARKSKTFLHGDIHFWNILFPRDPSTHAVRIFDWNSWDIGKGTNDLAYMLGLHWYPSLRMRFEKTLLKRYRDRLVENGVEEYSWDDCWLDYRESCIMNLFIPVWQWQRQDISAAVWWSHLERSFLTYDDLRCEELL